MQIIVCPMLVLPSLFEISRNEHTCQLSTIKIVKGEKTNWHSVFFFFTLRSSYMGIYNACGWCSVGVTRSFALSPVRRRCERMLRCKVVKAKERKCEEAKTKVGRWGSDTAIVSSLSQFGLPPNSTIINRRSQKCEVAKMRVRSYEGEGGIVVSFLRHCNFACSPTHLQRFSVAS